MLSTSTKGFRLDINGWTVSVMIGVHNYCDNRHLKMFDSDGNLIVRNTHKSENCEIAIFPTNNVVSRPCCDNWLDLGGDTVQGYVPTSALPGLFNVLHCNPAADKCALEILVSEYLHQWL